MSKIPLDIFGENFLRELFATVDKNLLPEFPENYPSHLAGKKFHRNFEKKVLKGWKVLNDNSEEIVVYTHIPFCKQVCKFCGFYREANPSEKEINDYLKALDKEVSFFKGFFANKPLKWLFFGGGTPSILNEEQIESLFCIFKENLNVAKNTGIAFESSPQTLNYQKIKKLKELGVKYLAIGVQSFDDNLMKKYNRTQTKKECLKAFEYARKAGIENIEADLIVGLPGQSEKSFMNDIKILSRMNLERVYIFDYQPRFLTSEYCTQSGSLPIRDLEKAREWRKRGIEELIKNGYSLGSGHWVYKRGGHGWPYSYDQQEDTCYSILAFGSSAIGYCKGKFRYQNIPNVKKYISTLKSGSLPIDSIFFLSERDEMVSYILLSFIQRGQLNLNDFEKRFGKKIETYFKKEIKKLENAGLLFRSKDLLLITNRYRAIFALKSVFYSVEVIEKLAKRFDLKIIYDKSNKINKISLPKKKEGPFLNLHFHRDIKKMAKEMKRRLYYGNESIVLIGKGKYISKLPILANLAKRIGFRNVLSIVNIVDAHKISAFANNILGKLCINIPEKRISYIEKYVPIFKNKKTEILLVQITSPWADLKKLTRFAGKIGAKKIVFYVSNRNDISKIRFLHCYSIFKAFFVEADKWAKKTNFEIKFLDIPLCILHPYENLFYSFETFTAADARESDVSSVKLKSCLPCKYIFVCSGPSIEYLQKFGYMEIKPVK